MKFRSTETDEGRLTKGKIYCGSIVIKSEERENVRPKSHHEIRIVVFNDNKEWRDYRASRFEPVED